MEEVVAALPSPPPFLPIPLRSRWRGEGGGRQQLQHGPPLPLSLFLSDPPGWGRSVVVAAAVEGSREVAAGGGAVTTTP